MNNSFYVMTITFPSTISLNEFKVLPRVFVRISLSEHFSTEISLRQNGFLIKKISLKSVKD